jgi:uncharacterized protein
MSLTVNLRHLEKRDLTLRGEIPVAELDLEQVDDLIRARQPLKHDLQVQLLEDGLLVQGQLELIIECDCVRCLKKFEYRVALPQWSCHLALEGEEHVKVSHDSVDLTPYLREDIVLAFPRYPLCDTACRGLPQAPPHSSPEAGGALQTEANVSVWAELSKLKL